MPATSMSYQFHFNILKSKFSIEHLAQGIVDASSCSNLAREVGRRYIQIGHGRS